MVRPTSEIWLLSRGVRQIRLLSPGTRSCGLRISCGAGVSDQIPLGNLRRLRHQIGGVGAVAVQPPPEAAVSCDPDREDKGDDRISEDQGKDGTNGGASDERGSHSIQRPKHGPQFARIISVQIRRHEMPIWRLASGVWRLALLRLSLLRGLLSCLLRRLARGPLLRCRYFPRGDPLPSGDQQLDCSFEGDGVGVFAGS